MTGQQSGARAASPGREASPNDGGIPDHVTLPDGRSIPVRAMTPRDAGILHEFFCRVPASDLLFLRRDVTDRTVIDRWAADIAEGQTVTLLAEEGGRVLGEASIHRNRVPWSTHVGEIRVVVDADQRTKGLGSALVQAIFMVALGQGIEKLVAEMTPDQKGAINVFQKLGFRAEGLLCNHVRDRAGETHDLIVMAHEVHAGSGNLQQWGVSEAMGEAE